MLQSLKSWPAGGWIWLHNVAFSARQAQSSKGGVRNFGVNLRGRSDQPSKEFDGTMVRPVTRRLSIESSSPFREVSTFSNLSL